MLAPTLPHRFEHVRPTLRLRLFGSIPLALGETRMRELCGGLAMADTPAVTIAGELLVGVVCEREGGSVPIPAEAAQRTWGVGFGDLLAEAVDNSPAPQPGSVTAIRPGAYAISDGEFAARLLVDPSAISAFPILGDPVLLAPAEGLVVLTGSADRAGLHAIATALNEAPYSGAALVSDVPLVQRGAGWETFRWPDDPDLQTVLAWTQRRYAAAWYTAQAPLLSSGPARPAPAEVFTKNGGPVLVTTAYRGVETLLPNADEVMIADHTGVVAVVPFTALVRLPGVTRTGLHPCRFHLPGDLPL